MFHLIKFTNYFKTLLESGSVYLMLGAPASLYSSHLTLLTRLSDTTAVFFCLFVFLF